MKLVKQAIFRSERGISILESLIAVAIISSMVFLLISLPNALMLFSKSKHLSLAREIAVKLIEDKRAISYANLPSGESALSDVRLSLLPQGSGTVVLGFKQDNGIWLDCDPTLCTNGEYIKQIAVTINWVDNNKPQSVTLKTMITEGGISQ